MSKDRKDIIGYKYKDDEAELREQIAQEIEACVHNTLTSNPMLRGAEATGYFRAAAIARGKK